jgi:hypothetical protein
MGTNCLVSVVSPSASHSGDPGLKYLTENWLPCQRSVTTSFFVFSDLLFIDPVIQHCVV